MIKKIAILTSLFDYPPKWQPSFYHNASKYFNNTDIHIARNYSLINSNSYYDKLYYYKIVKVLDYILENLINKYEYILFLDATDTNFINDPSDIVDKFKRLSCSIVMGAEKGLWPPTDYTYLYDQKPVLSEYKYLNSGTYFGYIDKIIYYLQNIINNKYPGVDDQGQWTIQYLLNNDIIIDQKQEFFFSTYQSKNNIVIDNKKIMLKNSSAYIVHDNGGFNDETIKLTGLINENY